MKNKIKIILSIIAILLISIASGFGSYLGSIKNTAAHYEATQKQADQLQTTMKRLGQQIQNRISVYDNLTVQAIESQLKMDSIFLTVLENSKQKVVNTEIKNYKTSRLKLDSLISVAKKIPTIQW